MKHTHIIFIIVSTFLTTVMVVVFYNYYFFEPLKSNGELFPERIENFSESDMEKKLEDFETPENSENKMLSNGKFDISEEFKNDYGITMDELEKIEKKIYFIDGREPEEFESSHVQRAVHIRTLDITKETIKSRLNIDDLEFQNSFFVLYCHNGTRTSDVISKMNNNNFKFLLNGYGALSQSSKFQMYHNSKISVFKKDIQNQDFTINTNEALKFLNKNSSLFIDGRLYSDENKLPLYFDFRIGKLSTKEYERKLNHILQYKDKNIVYIAEIYPDLFYAKLLIQRLEEKYDFNPKYFHILFNQSEEFYQQGK